MSMDNLYELHEGNFECVCKYTKGFGVHSAALEEFVDDGWAQE